MATLWNAFSGWEQVFLVAFAVGCALALSGYLIALLAREPFDEDALDEPGKGE